MSHREEMNRAERSFMDSVANECAKAQAPRGDTFMLAGHVAGDMFVLGEISLDAAMNLIGAQRNRRQRPNP